MTANMTEGEAKAKAYREQGERAMKKMRAEAERFRKLGMAARTDGAAKALFGVSAGLNHARRMLAKSVKP